MATESIPRSCSLTHCDEPHSAHGYCKAHWARIVAHGDKADLLKPIRKMGRPAKHVGCLIEGCEGTHQARGYCVKHYERVLNYGDAEFVTKGYKGNVRKWTDSDFPEWFWSQVAVTANPDRCWEWQWIRNTAGYGRFRVDGRDQLAHRIAWAVANGRMPQEELMVLHSCDNPPCCNPKHLREGTAQENTKDMVIRDRVRKAQGERQHCAKLTAEQVRTIREMEGASTPNIIATLGLDTTPSTVNKARRGASWKHIL